MKLFGKDRPVHGISLGFCWTALPLLLALVGGCSSTRHRITTQSLLREMTDLRTLAEFPSPSFTCRQFSSYDRKSVTPDDTETWFANGDWGQFIREEKVAERTEFVLADMDGPGAIVRIWSANPKGTLRIYLDGKETPQIECPMADFLGGRLPWNPPPISGERSRGWNSYLPIPYAKHCKVTCDQKDFYYHVNYRTYRRGSRVETFDVARMSQLTEELAATRQSLLDLRSASGPIPMASPEEPREVKDTPVLDLPAKREELVVEVPGPMAIHELMLDFSGNDGVAAMLRHVILRIEFDGVTRVIAPVSDFFGCGPGVASYQSLPLEVRAGPVLISRWSMPFRRSARVYLDNLNAHTIPVAVTVAARPQRWRSSSSYFNAKTRIERNVPSRPMIDWNYLTVVGKGVFVGTAFNIANPVREWWGEGDEKIYVDGETFPSHFGTGTEDYFGYAWCCNVPFQHAYHNQPRCDGPHNYGWTAVNRWHLIDRIPFRKSFRFDMELWHWNQQTDVDMAVTAYWYARPGSTDAFPPLNPADLVARDIPPYTPPRTPGAIEGEEMKIVEKTGIVEPQGVLGCSNDEHLWWREGHKPGDRLVLLFQVPQAGRYSVVGRFVKAVDYGVHRLAINGMGAGGPIDFYNNGVVMSEEISLGEFELQAGENLLTVEVIGANDQAIKKYMFGLDYLKLGPPKP